jgi:hypothetical protein
MNGISRSLKNARLPFDSLMALSNVEGLRCPHRQGKVTSDKARVTSSWFISLLVTRYSFLAP